MKKINNKLLVIGLAVLIGIFVLSKLFRSPKLEGNIRKELVSLDTADITEIKLASSGETPKVIRLNRKNGTWTAFQEDKSYPVDRNSISSLLTTLADMNAVRMVSRKKDKWDSYGVGEKSTDVSIFAGSDKEAEFRVGKTGFNQTQGGQQQFGRQGIEAYTYVRMADEEEVYMVNGFLESTFNRSINDWRDKSLLRFTPGDVQRVSFQYPSDSSFVLEKKDSVWVANGRPADKAKVENFLNSFSRRNETSFADSFTPVGAPTFTVQFEGATGPLSVVEGWKQEPGTWYLKSSLQPEVYFLNNDASAMSRLFPGAAKF